MEYPYKTVFVINNTVVSMAVYYGPGGVASGPPESTPYDLPGNSPVELGWRRIVDENEEPPTVNWRPPA